MRSSLTPAWSDEDIETFLVTLIVISLVTAATWCLLFFNPFTRKEHTANNANIPVPPIVRATAPPGVHIRPLRTNHTTTQNDDKGIISVLKHHTCTPLHHRVTSSNNQILTTMQPHEGILPFRHTRASVHEHAIDEPTIQTIRKDRARIFARLFRGTSFRDPPARGSHIVVAVSEDEVGCEILARVLYLLGTYYSLFVLLCMANDVSQYEEDTEERKKEMEGDEYKHEKMRMDRLIRSLRCERRTDEIEDEEEYGTTTTAATSTETTTSPLPEDVLPTHRIVANGSVFGRVAFVRQLPRKPEFVLDHDKEVKGQLDRFGFSVILYKKTKGRIGKGVVSGIGKELLS